MLHVILNLLVLELTPDQPLKREYRICRVDNGLTLGRQTDKTLAVLGESDNGGCRPSTLSILNYPRLFALHHGNAGICRSQVNTDDGAYRRFAEPHGS